MGRAVSRSELLKRLWGFQFDGGSNLVDAMICSLRRKIDPGKRLGVIATVRGVGYRFDRPASV